MKNKQKQGFTIAEVLITIGIVGVVAALTIPTLIQNSNSKKFSTQFKKALSTLNQAAISAQAQYDMDYGSISSDSDSSTCGSDTFSASNSTMCALLNSTLSAKNYMGVYGQVQGYKTGTTYAFTKTTDGFDPANFLLYTLADGSIVGFNPNAKRCSLESGQTINKTVLTAPNGLANCIGFIDVNGVSLPNKEVTCADGTSSLDVYTPCTLKTTGSKVGDVYPIVFHNGTVEPATNAGLAQFGAGKSADIQDVNEQILFGKTYSGEPIYISRTVYSNDKIYEYDDSKGYYVAKDKDGNVDISTVLEPKSGNIYKYDETHNFYYQSEWNGSYNINSGFLYPDGTLYDYGAIGYNTWNMKMQRGYSDDDIYGPSVLVFDSKEPYILTQDPKNKNAYVSEVSPNTGCYVKVNIGSSWYNVTFSKKCQ